MAQKQTRPECAGERLETTPLRTAASNGVSHVALLPRSDHLQLKPTRGFPVLGAAVGVMLLATGMTISLASGHPAGMFVAAVGAVFAAVFAAILLLARRHAFDRAAGTWSVTGLRARVRPLEEIKAVQLIQGDWYGSSGQAQFFTYQLNLALAGGGRVNVTNMANWPATWALGSQLAEFLEVPLLDDVSQE